MKWNLNSLFTLNQSNNRNITRHFVYCSVEGVSEGERVHLECRLKPVNDPNLKVEWFVNGVEIKAGELLLPPFTP